MTNNNNVLFKYVIGMPTTVTAGTFYWVWLSSTEKNKLFFSPTGDASDLLRLDNVLAGGNVSTTTNNLVQLSDIISLAGVDSDSDAWSTTDWQDAVKAYADEKKYGELTGNVYKPGCVIVSGSREFICTESVITYDLVNVGGVDYYQTQTDSVYVDEDNNPIPSTQDAPADAKVSSIETSWEMFGNLTEDLAANIAKHTTVKKEGAYINVVEGVNADGGKEYTLSLNVETNTIDATYGSDSDEFSFNSSNSEALVTSGDVTNSLNEVVEYVNTNITGVQETIDYRLSWISVDVS